MYTSQHERQLMKSAMEMAVLTTIQHPNIVRVFACLTDLVEEAGGLGQHSCTCGNLAASGAYSAVLHAVVLLL